METLSGRLERLSLHESSLSRCRPIHLYSQDLDLLSDVQMDSGLLPLLKRCTAKIRFRLFSSSMNTPRIALGLHGMTW